MWNRDRATAPPDDPTLGEAEKAPSNDGPPSFVMPRPVKGGPMTLGYELGELPRGELLSEEPGVGPAPPAIPPRPAPPAVSLAGPPPRPDLRAAPPAPPAHRLTQAGPPPPPQQLPPPP